MLATPSVNRPYETYSVYLQPCLRCSRLVGAIISRFEQRGYKLAALKLKQADEELLKTHYK